ncbi:hypothetical protein NESM_000166900 [Novymonas esmeraldas]|uniref:Uncharacterized protein n=1 Tax=Novymonas esmeraldas TaxID=1808958 RepID=A0AAW0F4V8_9TRYP
MTVPPTCVRVSLFQCSSARDAASRSSTLRAPQIERTATAEKQPLLRSRLSDYRGDLLLPVASLTSPPPLLKETEETVAATPSQLCDGLERRLSMYCILHVPADRAAAFAEEHPLAPACSSPSLSPAAPPQPHDVQDVQDAAPPPMSHSPDPRGVCCFCAGCSTAAAAAAAAAVGDDGGGSGSGGAHHGGSPSEVEPLRVSLPHTPWICIRQLQRMCSSRTTLVASSSPSRSRSPPPSVEAWMLRQHDSVGESLTAAEAHRIGVVDAAEDTGVEGGAGYAAFFTLTMIPAAAQAARCRGSGAGLPGHAPLAAGAATTAAQPSTAFTVRALRHTLRMGVPPPPPPPPPSATQLHSGGDDGQAPLSWSPTVGEVVVDRLSLQRGIRARRLVDTHSGAAVLPCESAAGMLAAQVAELEVECDEPSSLSVPHREGLTQLLLTPLPPIPAPRQLRGGVAARADAAPDVLDRPALQGDDGRQMERHHHYHHHYSHDDYIGLGDANSWAERHTLISLSDLPSESATHVDSVTRGASSRSTIYAASQPSGAASSAVLLSTDNSRSLPVPPVASHHRGGPSVAQREDDLTRPRMGMEDQETVPLSPAPRDTAATVVLDSLQDMNEVFLYVDEETVATADGLASGGGERDCQQLERRSSLVWSTPATRGSATAVLFGESVGYGATPLMYRTNTRGSRSPPPSPSSGATPLTPLARRTILAATPSSSSSSTAFTSLSPAEGGVAAVPTQEITAASGEERGPAPSAAVAAPLSSTGSSTATGVPSAPPSSAGCSAPSTPSGAARTALVAGTSSAASSSPSHSLPSPQPHRLPISAVAAHLDERTTSIAPSATPQSRRGTSEHELRSRLQSLNPIATQSSGRHTSRVAPSAAPRTSVSRWPDAVEDTGECDVRCRSTSSARKRRRVTEVAVAVPALRSTDSSPTAAVRREGRQSQAAAPSLPSSPSIDGGRHSDATGSRASTPSTAVAARQVRRRSPIYFSPGELRGFIAVDAARAPSSSALGWRSSPAGTSHEGASEATEGTGGQGYGRDGYVARYRPSHDYAVDGRTSSSASFADFFSSSSSAASARRSDAAMSAPRQPSVPLVLESAEEVVSLAQPPQRRRRLRRSLSLSATGLETWIRFSDEEGSGGDGGGDDCDPGDGRHGMLVTQQEIPLYAVGSDSSAASDSDSSLHTIDSDTTTDYA